jgi:outer membrane lipoprotein-sorting protein
MMKLVKPAFGVASTLRRVNSKAPALLQAKRLAFISDVGWSLRRTLSLTRHLLLRVNPFFMGWRVKPAMTGTLWTLWCLILLLVATPAFAQKDAKAKALLDKTSAAFSQAGALSIRFTMQVKSGTDKNSQSFEGTIDLKGTKFHVNTPDIETWFDGKTQWTLQKATDEVSITQPDAKEIQTINPATIINLYKKGYYYRSVSANVVELTPQLKNAEMTKIILQTGTDNLPVKIQITYKNKMENIIHLTRYKKNAALTDATFVFDKKKYPQVEIVDLR